MRISLFSSEYASTYNQALAVAIVVMLPVLIVFIVMQRKFIEGLARSALPIIGINKQRNPRWPVYITPTVAAARPVVRAGAAIVAVDATHRPRKGDASPEALMAALKKELRCLPRPLLPPVRMPSSSERPSRIRSPLL